MDEPRGVYQRMSDKELKRSRSIKVNMLNRLVNTNGYFGARDASRLADQIKAIDAERAYRLLRKPLF